MDGNGDGIPLTETENHQNHSLKKKENEVAEVLSKIEKGHCELYKSSGTSPAWKKFLKIRDTTSKQRINYVQCVECNALLTYNDHCGTTHLNRHKCKLNNPSAEFLPFRKLPGEKVDEVQEVLVKNVMKFCAESVSPCEAICGSPIFINFLQLFVTMGRNLGNIGLKEVFPKSNIVHRNIEILQDKNRREIYAKFRESFKNGWCSSSLHIQQVLSGPVDKLVLFMRIQYFETDISAISNRVVFAAAIDRKISPDLFLTKLVNSFNEFGGHEEDILRLTMITDNKPIFIEALDKFPRKDCVADILVDILNEAFNISANQETKEFLITCKGIVALLIESEIHNLNLVQDHGTWTNKLLMVRSINDQYNDIAIILQNTSQVNFKFNKRRAEEFISFLEPFIDALEDLSSISYTTANKVLLWWTAIKDHLETFPNYSYELKHIMINAMKCFRSKFVLTIDNKVDCFLDPRYKILKMLAESERSEVVTEVKKRLEDIIIEEIVAVPVPASTPTAPKAKKRRFEEYETKKGDTSLVLPKKVSKKSKEAKKNEDRFKRFETDNNEEVNLNDEVVRYLKLPAMLSSQFESEFDVIRKFWKSQKKNLPKLYQLATSRLHTPVTCGCVGQNRSSQQSLKEETLNDLLFIKDKLEDADDRN